MEAEKKRVDPATWNAPIPVRRVAIELAELCDDPTGPGNLGAPALEWLAACCYHHLLPEKVMTEKFAAAVEQTLRVVNEMSTVAPPDAPQAQFAARLRADLAKLMVVARAFDQQLGEAQRLAPELFEAEPEPEAPSRTAAVSANSGRE